MGFPEYVEHMKTAEGAQLFQQYDEFKRNAPADFVTESVDHQARYTYELSGEYLVLTNRECINAFGKGPQGARGPVVPNM